MLGTFIFIEFIIILVFIAVIVMQIILFFKIWKMTDDVAELKNFLLIPNRSLERDLSLYF